MVIIAAMFLWWSMHVDVKFHSHSEWNFFQQVTGEAYRHLSEASCYLNMIGLALIYALLVTCINRFWVGTALFGTLVMVFSVATRIKVTMRNEPVIPPISASSLAMVAEEPVRWHHSSQRNLNL